MNIVVKILSLLLVFYVFVCILLYFLQERMIFFPEKLEKDFQFQFKGDFEEKFFQVDEQTTLHALHFFSENPKGVILYFHGNAGSLRDWGYIADDFVNLGYDILIPDYRGFGKSTGAMSETNFYQDAQMLFDFLAEKYATEKIVIYGRSLGTGIAVDLATKNKAQQLILETPFTSFGNLAASRFKIFPVRVLLQFPFKTDEKISKINFPIHLFHGTKDEVIPYSESEKLISILKQPNALTTIENGFHNNLGTSEKYWEKIKELLQ